MPHAQSRMPEPGQADARTPLMEPAALDNDWSSAKLGNCDQCGSRGYVVPVGDEQHCSGCCTSNLLTDWQDYARQAVAHLSASQTQVGELSRMLAECDAPQGAAQQDGACSECDRRAERARIEEAFDQERARGYRDGLAGQSLGRPALEEPPSLYDAYCEAFDRGKAEFHAAQSNQERPGE